MVKEKVKDVVGEENDKVTLDDAYKDENNDDVELHVEDMHNLYLDTYKLVDDLLHQNLIQS